MSLDIHGRFARAASRRMAIALLIASAGLTACSDGDEDDDDIRGTWELSDDSGILLEITSSTVTIYEDAGDCHARFVFDIVDSEGDVYSLESDGFELDLEIERSGDDLVINGLGEETVFESSDVDVDDLEICEDDLGTPSFGSCASLPEFAGGVTGTLDETDDQSNGFFYDAYRLESAGSFTWVIEMESEEIDTYLYLYNSAGALIASNDDFNFTNSMIEIDLAAGCYIVAASSFGHGEVGTYTIVANTI